MNKVVNVQLGGRAYQLEESAYDALRVYLNDAEAKLAGNPDKEEIVKDLEQAIGGKCDAYLSAHKTVVLLADIEAVLVEMGPVDTSGEGNAAGSNADSKEAGAGESASAHRRLYQIRDGSIIAGVCTGLAAYFNVDVLLVRILFVVFTIVTHGAGVALYILLVIFIPHARTAKEYQEAAGVPPVTAQVLVDRAKEGYDQVIKNSGQWQAWGHQWKNQHRAWKAQHKAWSRAQQKAHKQSMRYEYGTPGRKSFLTELNEFIWSMFGLLVVSFFIWFVYHHVPLVQQFLDSIKVLWDKAIYAIAQLIDSNNN